MHDSIHIHVTCSGSSVHGTRTFAQAQVPDIVPLGFDIAVRAGDYSGWSENHGAGSIPIGSVSAVLQGLSATSQAGFCGSLDSSLVTHQLDLDTTAHAPSRA